MTDQYWDSPRFEDLYVIQESHGGGPSKQNPLVQLDPGLFIWTIITFLLLFFVLAKFAWKPILQSLKEREDKIKSALENADQAKEELDRLNQQSEEIIDRAKSEAKSIRAQAKVTSKKIKEDMISKATEEAKKILIDAENQIKIEKDKAVDEIRNEVVHLALVAAEKVIKRNLSSKENQEMIKDSLKGLENYSV